MEEITFNIKDLLNKLKSVPKHYWVLVFIITLGIFLRSYNFHDWLYFANDQARDAEIVLKVVKGQASWPMLGPSMRNSAVPSTNLFYLGPAFYYAEIISVMLFGTEPDRLAYPDLVFGILSLPIFYLFLRRYFSANLALSLAGIFSISYYAINFTRFAWNPNPIPFFAFLLLLSLHEFLIKREKTGWMWVILLGVAVGVGIQLHVITLVLFLLTTFFVAFFILIKNKKTWKKFCSVFLIILFLNSTQVISEYKNNFANSMAFSESLLSKEADGDRTLTKVANNIDCHVEANLFMISYFGEDSCQFFHTSFFKSFQKKKGASLKLAFMSVAMLFSLFGYGALFYLFRGERDMNKKCFLGLVILYAAISFLVMIPAVANAEFRYFIHVLFMPFLFLGFITVLLGRKRYVPVVAIYGFLIVTNVFQLVMLTKNLYNERASDAHSVYLGEAEQIRNYIAASIFNEKRFYFLGDRKHFATYIKPLEYLFRITDKKLIRVGENEEMTPGVPVFYIYGNSESNSPRELGGYKVEDYRNFGQIGIYKLVN